MPVMADVAGTDLFYIEKGSGVPLVFVHGSLGDYRTFEQQVEEFSIRFRVIAYSRRFHPPNPWPPGDNIYSSLHHGRDLAILLRRLEVRSAIIVASSYGAYTALMMALENRDVVMAMVLGEPPILPMLHWSMRGRELAASFGKIVDRSRAAFARNDLENGLRYFFDGIRGSAGAFDRLSPGGQAQLMTFAREMQCELLTPDEFLFPVVRREDLQGLDIPTLLVTGQTSPELFHIISAEIGACLPNVRHVEIPDAGHAMHSANPAFYNKEVLAFLAHF